MDSRLTKVAPLTPFAAFLARRTHLWELPHRLYWLRQLPRRHHAVEPTGILYDVMWQQRLSSQLKLSWRSSELHARKWHSCIWLGRVPRPHWHQTTASRHSLVPIGSNSLA